MYGNELAEGLILPITENGIKQLYVTNAPFEIIQKCFHNLIIYNLSEFCEAINEEGFKINVYRSSIELNFDEL